MGKRKADGIQRVVRSYIGAGRFGKVLGTSSMLGHWALAKQREEAVYSYSLSKGLSTELQNALNDITGDDHLDFGSSKGMEIDGIGPDINAGDAANSKDSSAELSSSQNVVDLRDFIGVNKWHGRRKYKDAQTWKQHIQRFNNAWASIIDKLVDEYICWNYNSKPSTGSPSDSWEFSIEIIDIHSLTHQTTIYQDSETKTTSALVHAGYLPASPESPSIAVSLHMLELFYAMQLFKPNFSVEAFAKMVCYLHLEPYRRTYRTALSDTFDIYLAILQKVESRIAKELGHDSPDYWALNSCELLQTFSHMVVVDGNNLLKCLHGVGKREVADTRVFGESDYYLSEEFVNLYANEVPARPPPKPAVEVEEDFTEDAIHQEKHFRLKWV
ncbi:hypothetical protein BDP27DRAFT_1418138 [Rhodocollybia butyracea]|uniref:Uncharacterized protein n=1 Tax=Rhodocollybia butyracea TaxID=206335 RepID=A0A9P5Q2R0_9AGAR|nr:hypothetical protein BDP27DRAFT_1418138 [Rhodocollybia butyracea]